MHRFFNSLIFMVSFSLVVQPIASCAYALEDMSQPRNVSTPRTPNVIDKAVYGLDLAATTFIGYLFFEKTPEMAKNLTIKPNGVDIMLLLVFLVPSFSLLSRTALEAKMLISQKPPLEKVFQSSLSLSKKSFLSSAMIYGGVAGLLYALRDPETGPSLLDLGIAAISLITISTGSLSKLLDTARLWRQSGSTAS